MKPTREQQESRLKQYAEQLVKELLDWEGKTERPDFTQIERKVLDLRRRFGQELARAAIEGQEAKQPVPGPRCRQCGQEMTYKGQKPVAPQTWLDKVEYERGYYYCGQCRVGFSPPG
jgi:hypothetical protein